MSPIKIARIAHIVLFVKDPAASAKWYCDVLGMQVSARVNDGPYKGGVFLSFGTHDHDIALFQSDGTAEKGREFEHIGLELANATIEDLRRGYAFFEEKGVKIAEVLNHGVSIGIYFYDPDGHMLEILCQQVESAGGKAIAELKANGGMAEPFNFAPARPC